MKRSILSSISVLAFFLLFPGCDKENPDTGQPGSIPEVQEYRVRDILEGEILSNAKVAEKLGRLTSTGGKMVDKNLNLKGPDITVIVDRATYVGKDGYGSYTFPVMQDKEENIRNVLFAPNGNQGYDAFLIEYPYNARALANGLSPEQRAEPVTVFPLDIGMDQLAGKMYATWICRYEYRKVYGYVNGTGGNLTGDMGYRWSLHATTCYVARTYTGDRSTFSADGNTHTINIDMPGGGGGGGFATSPTPTIYDEAELLKINVLKRELRPNFPQKRYIDSHPSNSFKLHDFLVENKFSEGAKAFAKEALQALMDGGKVDFDGITYVMQNQQDYLSRMSLRERVIYDAMSTFNKFGYLLNGQKATWKAEELYPDSLYNGRGDAFRHAYFNALNAILLGAVLAENLATAHEDKPLNYPNNFKEKQMDLFNNAVGRTKKDWFSDGYATLTESILDAITNGELRYLSHLLGGGNTGQATNLSQLISTN